MFYRFKRQYQRDRFNRLTAGILQTPPMPVVEAPWAIISMVSNGDIQMYLLAMKSFYSRLKRGKIIAIIDRDMPAESRRTLERHLPGITFTILEDIDTGGCQRGGTWERVLFLADHSAREYAIQLDSDTLTFGDIEEVIACVENNIPFTLGDTGQPIEPMRDAVAPAKAKNSDYVGIALERAFDRYAGADNLNYVRGSSAFVGLSHGGIGRQDLEAFHREGERLLGSRWREWGTEQSASNFAVANSPNAVVLPYPKYANFNPSYKHEGSFLHFFGTHRFVGDYFAELGNVVIRRLLTADGQDRPLLQCSA